MCAVCVTGRGERQGGREGEKGSKPMANLKYNSSSIIHLVFFETRSLLALDPVEPPVSASQVWTHKHTIPLAFFVGAGD